MVQTSFAERKQKRKKKIRLKQYVSLRSKGRQLKSIYNMETPSFETTTKVFVGNHLYHVTFGFNLPSAFRGGDSI
jgi:hypothetical protein